jgi:glycosyltransferase involved in cell wall biosynthesis
MKFICLLPVRDEADIIGQCLDRLLTWSDEIYVFDTGSVDKTWEIVQDHASRDSRVVPLRKDPVYFSETRLRGWLFHQARSSLRTGDWFLRVDADEFHHVPPPEFVKTCLRPHETIVYHQYYNFALLQREVEAWEAGLETLADRARPIAERRQWYTPSVYAEPRLCRYRETMQWPPTISFPYNAGFVAVERLPIRHYPHRDPVQLERRCRLRAVMFMDESRESGSFSHWAEKEWRKFVTPDSDPGLRYWDPSSTLPEVKQFNHLARRPKRFCQRFAHGCLLPFLDRLRPTWPEETVLQPIPPELVRKLEEELKI